MLFAWFVGTVNHVLINSIFRTRTRLIFHIDSAKIVWNVRIDDSNVRIDENWQCLFVVVFLPFSNGKPHGDIYICEYVNICVWKCVCVFIKSIIMDNLTVSNRKVSPLMPQIFFRVSDTARWSPEIDVIPLVDPMADLFFLSDKFLNSTSWPLGSAMEKFIKCREKKTTL